MLTRIENWLFDLLNARRRARAAAIGARWLARQEEEAFGREALCTCGAGRLQPKEHDGRFGHRCPVFRPF